MTEEEMTAFEKRLLAEEIEVLHIQTERGCVVSLNGQGHFPCNFHRRRARVSKTNEDDILEPSTYTDAPPPVSPVQDEGEIQDV